ncbi:MAG: NrdJb, partial [Aeromonas veronii]
MVKKIDKKIVAYKVRTKDEPQEDLSAQDDVV